jgi:hypothetical protein
MSKKKVTAKKTAKERQLEELVFGKDVVHEITKAAAVAAADARPVKRPHGGDTTTQQPPSLSAAWQDEDDDTLGVNLSATNRLKKLKRGNSSSSSSGGGDAETTVSASALSQLLQERFQTRQLAWATVTDETDADADVDGSRLLLQHTESLTASRRRSKQGRGSGGGNTDSFVVDDAATAGPGALPEGKVNIVRLTDANAAEPSRAQEPVSAVQFHPSGRLVMVASGDKMLRFFAVDGDKVTDVPLSHPR